MNDQPLNEELLIVPPPPCETCPKLTTMEQCGLRTFLGPDCIVCHDYYLYTCSLPYGDDWTQRKPTREMQARAYPEDDDMQAQLCGS